MLELLKEAARGLSKEYYLRQILFGCVCAILYILLMFNNGYPGVENIIKLVIWVPINTLLYPYSRFVYESIVDYIVGENSYFVNVTDFILVKIITIFLCWWLAIYIAPIGLLYIGYKQRNKVSETEEVDQNSTPEK